MKSFLKWTGLIIGVGIGAAFAARAVQAGRARLRQAIGRAETIADHTRAALEETEAALHQARTAI
jgi:hypothetical protein